MNIIWPNNTKEVIDAIRSAIGRDVQFVRKTSVDCTICTLDPITNTSTDSFCPACSGEGYLISYSGVSVLAHVTHSPAELLQWVSGGQLPEGDCKLQVEYTVANLDAIDTAEYVLVDGLKFDIRSRIFRGVQTINRIIVNIIQRQE